MAGIEVIIGANTDGLDAAVSRSRRTVNQLSDDLKQGIGTVAKYGAATAAAGIAVGVLAVKSIEAAREVVGLARVANSSVATFQRWPSGPSQLALKADSLPTFSRICQIALVTSSPRAAAPWQTFLSK